METSIYHNCRNKYDRYGIVSDSPWTNNSYYWLRTPGNLSGRGTCVDTSGAINLLNNVANAAISVRPAITVKLVP